MTDPLSVTVAIVSLAQAAIGAGQEVFDLISKLRGASAQLKQLKNEAGQLNRIIGNVIRLRGSCQESNLVRKNGESFKSIEQHLENIRQDMSKLRTIVEELSGQPRTRLDRVKTPIKSVLRGRKIEEISSQIVRHKRDLQLDLVIILGGSVSQIAEKLDCLDNSQATMQAKTTELATRNNRELHLIPKNPDDLILESDNPAGPATMKEYEATLLLSGSVSDADTSLRGLYPHIYGILKSSEKGIQSIISRSNASWLLTGYHALLQDVFDENVLEMTPQQLSPNLCDCQTYRGGTLQWASPIKMHPSATYGKILPSCSYSSGPVSTTLIETAIVELCVSEGKLLILFSSGSQRASPVDSDYPISVGRFFFVPTMESSFVGITAMFFRHPAGVTRIPRTLSIFRPRPDNSPIFNYLKARDVGMVRKMLLASSLSPNDRDESGNSLIWYAISKYYDYDMCNLLLEYGAEPSDCNRYGDHALAVLVGNLSKNRESTLEIPGQLMSLVRRLMQHCRPDEVRLTSQYKRRRGIELAPAGLLHCALFRNNSKISILKLLDFILKKKFDLEARDTNGNTPLMYALFYTPQSARFEVVSALLEAGAMTDAFNKYGEGCLHLLLRRLSACDNNEMDPASKKATINILVMLLDRGCDPRSPNVVGYTPLDAALSPIAWPLFCSALEKVGKDVEKVIQEIDMMSDIMSTDAEVEERLEYVVERHNSVMPRLSHWTMPEVASGQPFAEQLCYLCGRGTNLVKRVIPFDEFRSVVVDELEFGIHMIWYNHHNGGDGECLGVWKEDSSHFLDYCPSKMNYEDRKNRSWRRHVAYLLWRKGVLYVIRSHNYGWLSSSQFDMNNY